MLLKKTGLLLTFLVVVFGLFFCAGIFRNMKVASKTGEIKELIEIGDDIFEAKKKIEENGFKVTYGPDFPTASRSYYMMIIDYGVRPNASDEFRELINMPGNLKISGIIEADKDGKIYEIK